MNSRNFLLMVLEAGSPQSGCPHGQVLVTFPLLTCKLFVSSPGGMARELTRASYIRALIPFMT